MRMPMKARSIARLSTLVAASSLMLSACSSEVTAPPSALSPTAANFSQSVRFNPNAGKKIVPVGQSETFVFTINPNVDNTLMMGAHALTIPARSVCALVGSGYGPSTWNSPCSAERLPFVITATVYGNNDGGRLEFSPALRFSPKEDVTLWMYSKHASEEDTKKLNIEYCPTLDRKSCYDESDADGSLGTNYDRKANVVFRKIKHFSGYVVAERGAADEGSSAISNY